MIVSYKKLFLVSTSALAISLSAGGARAQTSGAPVAKRAGNGIEEVVVTARRRAERAQTTPISVTAFSAVSLRQNNVTTVRDLDSVIPGFRFASEGGKSTNDVVLRGLSRIPVGEGVPAVVTYFSDVPLPGLGSNIPTFDLANLQVLKGPQGTLFGRNTLGGALLLTPAPPTDKFGGFIDATAGNFGENSVDGAINIPVVPGVLDVRVAGHYRRQNGYVNSINTSGHFDNIDENAYRISVVFTPTSYIKNTTIYDYLTAPETAAGAYLINVNPDVLPGFSPLFDPLNPQLESQAARLHAAGPWHAYADNVGDGYAFRRLQGLTNDTRVTLSDDLTIRNILGYRQSYNNQQINSGANAPLTLPLPTPFGLINLPFTLFDAAQLNNKEYLTDEVQVLGKSFDNKLSWIIGGFFNHDDPNGASGSNFVAFNFLPPPNAYTTALVTDTNYAIYGQGGLDLSDWVLKGLTLDLGYRYSWDSVHSCGGGSTQYGGYLTSSVCESIAAQHNIGGIGDVGAAGSDPSWTLGLDYKLSPHQFFYITSRRGYRGVNVNTPLFSSAYTTGGIVLPTPGVPGSGCNPPGGPVGQCPNLLPFQKTGAEKLTDVEIGSKSDFSVAGVPVRFDIDGFWSKYKGALQFFNVLGTGINAAAPDLPDSQSVGINAANETILGAEMSLTAVPLEGLTITLNGAYNNVTIDSISSPSTTGLALTKNQITIPSPRFSGTAAFSYLAPFHPLQSDVLLSGDWYQTGSFGAQYGRSFPGYGVGNMRLEAKNIGGRGLDIALYAKNILDRAYLISPIVLLSSFPTNSGVYAEPRTYGIEARYSF